MEDLLAVLNAKKKEAKVIQAQVAGGNRFVKRGDLERLREEEYLREQQAQEEERAKKRRRATAATSSREGEDGKEDQTKQQQEEEFLNITDVDLTKRLRKIKQPIKLFGESRKQTILRLKHLESTFSHLESGEGVQRHDFRDALKAAESTIAQDLIRKEKALRTGEDSNSGTVMGSEGVEVNKDAEFLFKDASVLDVDVDVDANLDTRHISPQLLDSNPALVQKLIKVYVKRLLKDWGASLMEMDIEKKQTSQGKLLFANLNQSYQYLKPLFKKLDKRQVEEDVLRRVTEICMYLQQREYVLANDAYLRMSIGNAAWPLGVTSVGIHERANREKISESQIAHALNDETQRKWIQSIKRLMTFCQSRYPPDDVSKIVG